MDAKYTPAVVPVREADMTGKGPHDLGDATRAVMRPAPPEPADTVRVAILYPQGDALAKAIEEAGVTVAYSHTPEHYEEKLDFEKVPVFDLVAANLPEDGEAKVEAMRYVSRYLYVRRPVSFVLVCEKNDNEFLGFVHERTWRMGYELSAGEAHPNNSGRPGQEKRAVVVGSLPGYAPSWPSGFTPTADRDSDDEGTGGVLDKYQGMEARQGVQELPTLTLGEVIRVVAQRGGEDPYFDDAATK